MASAACITNKSRPATYIPSKASCLYVKGAVCADINLANVLVEINTDQPATIGKPEVVARGSALDSFNISFTNEWVYLYGSPFSHASYTQSESVGFGS